MKESKQVRDFKRRARFIVGTLIRENGEHIGQMEWQAWKLREANADKIVFDLLHPIMGGVHRYSNWALAIAHRAATSFIEAQDYNVECWADSLTDTNLRELVQWLGASREPSRQLQNQHAAERAIATNRAMEIIVRNNDTPSDKLLTCAIQAAQYLQIVSIAWAVFNWCLKSTKKEKRK